MYIRTGLWNKCGERKMKKIYRILHGCVWKWESEGEFIKMTKVQSNVVVKEIDYYAERLIDQILNKSKQVVYNLK